MKRIFRLIALSLVFVLVLGITAQADMILEFQNNFLDWHRDDCKFYGRSNYINAAEGALGVYRKPNGKEVLGTLQNGEEVFISYTYGDEAWGVIRFSVPGGATGGWIRMDQTVLKYDSKSFIEDHSLLLYSDDGTAVQMLEGTMFPFTYPYPGAPASVSSVNAEHLLESKTVFDWLFEDENGLLWGYIKGRDCWICLSDPINPNLPVAEYQPLNLYPASDIEIQSESAPAWVLPTCLVAGVAVISIALILTLKKKRGAESWNNTQPGIMKPKTMKGRMKSLQCTGWRGDDRDFEA